MIAVIGSAALLKHGYMLRPKLGDIDLVGKYDDLLAFLKTLDCLEVKPFSGGKKLFARTEKLIYECEIAWPESTSEKLLELVLSDYETIHSGGLAYASPKLCYMLKMTHRFRKNNPHFLKTMNDIHVLRDAKHGIILPEHEEFYKLRLKETLNYGHPKLNQTKKEFFTDTVPYKYDHDSIHEAIKLFDKPAYAYFKPDESEVAVSKEMFFDLPREKQIAAVYEESAVLALERSQIPYPETPVDKSFRMAIEKVCTSITSGWFREFAWENYGDAVKLYRDQTMKGDNYLDVFNRVLATGKVVKPFEAVTA